MKVICRNCGDLIPEDDAIKMTVAEFIRLNMAKYDIDFSSSTMVDAKTYTQICEPCYRKEKWHG
jgi:ribosomal protein S26